MSVREHQGDSRPAIGLGEYRRCYPPSPPAVGPRSLRRRPNSTTGGENLSSLFSVLASVSQQRRPEGLKIGGRLAPGRALPLLLTDGSPLGLVREILVHRVIAHAAVDKVILRIIRAGLGQGSENRCLSADHAARATRQTLKGSV